MVIILYHQWIDRTELPFFSAAITILYLLSFVVKEQDVTAVDSMVVTKFVVQFY